MEGVSGRLYKQEWRPKQKRFGCFTANQQPQAMSMSASQTGSKQRTEGKMTEDSEWRGSGIDAGSREGSCASLTNVSFDSESWKRQLPILLDFVNQTATGAVIASPGSAHSDTHTPSSLPVTANGRPSKRNSVPKDISFLRSEILEAGLIAYADGINGTDGSAVVELNPVYWGTGDFFLEDITKILAYLHHVNQKLLLECPELPKNISGGLTAVVDCREARSAKEGINICFLALGGLLEWLPASLKRVFVVIHSSPEEEEGENSGKDWIPAQMDVFQLNFCLEPSGFCFKLDELKQERCELLTMEKLHEKISGSQLTKEIGGDRVPHGSQWIEFRKNLDSFLRNCRSLGEYYVDLYKDMRRTSGSSTDLWESAAEELQDLSWRLRDKLDHIQSSECFYVVRDEGDGRLVQLETVYPELFSVETYRKAVDKAAGLYREVRNIMGKAAVSVERRCGTLEIFVQAHAFLSQANELSKWADDVALPTADRQQKEPSVSLMRLRIQERQFEQFLASAKLKLESGERLLLDSEWLWSWEGTGTEDQDTGLPFTEEQRKELKKTWRNLVDKLEMTDRRLMSVRDRLADSLICHHMLDKVYDWALHNAKWSSQLGLLISAASSPEESSCVSLDTLSLEVQEQLDQYPAQELRQLPIYAVRLDDEKIQAQAATLTTRCTEAEQMLRSHKKKLEDLIAADNDGKSCAGSTEYEEPISRQMAQSNLNEEGRRRRSFAGTPSTSLNAVAECYEFRYRPLFQEKAESHHRLNTIASEEREDVAQGIITADMTDQVVSSMSANTLKKRLAERKNPADWKEGNKKTLPDPLPPPFQSCRIGSARCSKSRKPFRKLMKRSTTSEGLIHPPQTVPNLNIHPVTPLKDTVKQASLLSLTSIGEESLHSLSVSSDSTKNSAHGCPSFLAPPVPEVPSLDYDDDASSGSGKFPSDSHSPTRFDIPCQAPVLREEDFRLDSPPPDASPDLRMQLMIINELIQTELNYVGSLHYVIEHYVPEMKREDLPQELRGQRYSIFGNLEKIYDFHIQEFLPQLQSRIQKGKQTESLGLEIARCFLENRSKFHLYALYNKNKPKSELLMSECGAVFFRTRQLLLKDKLDLASYLLKPVQRMGKYALLLQHLLAACPADDQETAEVIRKAEEMVSFQLRHGNDLLAMDMIRGCDLNLKEQGQLLRQDEFVVWEGRGIPRKSLRRVFLFEHLVLFTKPRRSRGVVGSPSFPGGLLSDTYQHKHSIKMTDVGLTEKVKDSKLKFELWFRRHTSSSTSTLQSQSESVRNSWVDEIRRLLWRQAIRNRENRLTEMSSMGIGSKTCLDLKTSGAIQDRAVNSTLLNKVGNRFRSSFSTISSTANIGTRGKLWKTHPDGHSAGKRPHSLISLGSSSCSSNNSSLGSNGVQSHSAPQSFESGICADLSALEEDPDDVQLTVQEDSAVLPELTVVRESNPVTV